MSFSVGLFQYLFLSVCLSLFVSLCLSVRPSLPLSLPFFRGIHFNDMCCNLVKLVKLVKLVLDINRYSVVPITKSYVVIIVNCE